AGRAAARRLHADLGASIAMSDEAGVPHEPVQLAVRGSTDGTRFELERLTADLAGGHVETSGRFDTGSRALAIEGRADGLAWARLPRLPAGLRRLDGALSAEGALSGTPSAPLGPLPVALDGAAIDGSPLPALELEARADGRRLDLSGRAGEKPVVRGTGTLDGDWPASLAIDTAVFPAQALVDAFPQARALGATLGAR